MLTLFAALLYDVPVPVQPAVKTPLPVQSERNATLDCIKGFAICLVVWGHCIQYLSAGSNEQYLQDPVFAIIYSFHMPLFMAISGYLFYASQHRYGGRDLLIKKAKHLLLPAAAWWVLMLALRYVIHILTGSGITSAFHNIFWFLTANMFCAVVVYFCAELAKGSAAVYFLAPAMLLLLALPDGFDLKYDKFMLPYFAAGFLFCRHSRRIAPMAYGVAWIASLAAFCIMMMHWKTEYYIYTTGMSLYVPDPEHKLLIIGFRYLAGFAGIGSVVPAVHLLLRRAAAPLLTFLGRHTMGIYVLSVPLSPSLRFLRVPYLSGPLYDWVTTPLFACAVCALCIAGTRILQRAKVTRLVLLGEVSR
ncbi:MAG: acyltransferase [Terracidiphilus sp.]